VVEGLGDVTQYRGEIWKLLCKVQNLKCQYSRDVYSKFVRSATASDTQIHKDIFRSRAYCDDFSLPVESGKNRLYNLLKAYAAYD
jgi:hypothetical protein